MNQPSPALVKEAERYSNAHPADIVAVYSMDQRNRYASASHLSILGYAPDEVSGRPWTDFVVPDDHSHADLAGSDALLNGRSIEFGFKAVTKSGGRVSLRGTAWISPDPVTQEAFLFFHGVPQDHAGQGVI
jgi:PAS domain S-box-containing protein